MKLSADSRHVIGCMNVCTIKNKQIDRESAL